MWRLITICLGLLGAVILAVVWSGGSTQTPADFTFINRGDNKTLDPNSMSWLQDIRLAYALWEGLYALDPQTLEPIPGTADQIDVSKDGTIYTFHIRDGARWSDADGTPVLSDDFIFAWRRMLEQPGDYVGLLFYIKGARQYEEQYQAWAEAQPKHAPATQPRPDFGAVGIQKLGPRQLRVTLECPLAFFPSLCAFPPYFPQNEKSMRPFAYYANGDPRTGRIESYDQGFTRPPYLVTNGPYRMTDWIFQRRVRLEASEYYWDRANVKSKIIDEIIIDDNPVGALRAFQEAKIDWLSDVPGDIAADIIKFQGAKNLHTFPGFGTYFYTINCNPKLPDGRDNPFHDVRVRQAFAMSIDKKPIVENVTRMGEQVATDYIPPGIFKDYRSPPGQLYDVTTARRLLAEAGFPNGQGFPRVSILFNTEGMHNQIAQIIHHQWLENLNVDLDLQGVEIKTFGEYLHKHNYAIARASWIGDYDDPSTFTDKYQSDSENNDSAWSNPEYDRLSRAAVREIDPARRLRLFAQAEELLLREAPILPIYHYTNAYMYRDNVFGIVNNPRNMVMFKAVEVRR